MVITMTLLVILNANIVEITQFLMKIIKKISMPWAMGYILF